MNEGYAIISSTDAHYPQGVRGILGDATLYAIGNLNLLAKQAVGICGSRDASPEALERACRFGAEAVKRSFVVVSGYARGVDRQAHKGALERGGCTIAVLPNGIDHFKEVAELKPLIDLKRNFLAISMFAPDAPWVAWRAMERNKLTVGLSSRFFVIEARNSGGTINSALECVRQQKPLFVISYSKDLPGREGNRKLLSTTPARPLKEMRDLQDALEKSMSQAPEEVKQLALNLV